MILIDTHVLLWWASGETERLSSDAVRVIDQEHASGAIAISSISAWEIAMLVQRRRIALTMDVQKWCSTIAGIRNVLFIPVDHQIAVAAELLPGNFHRDPADRMIVATARKLDAPLVSMDVKIRSYAHVRTIW